MRLLQLATGPDELIDLHPNVTVVTGLDLWQRRDLAEAVTGLARGTATGPAGLLEAHGVLFDLTDELLALLDLDGGHLHPVVRAGDLPTRRTEPPVVRDLHAKEEDLAALDVQLATAAATEARVREELAEAVRRGLSRQARTEQASSLAAERRLLEAALAGQIAPRAAATANREEVEAATAEIRAAKQAAAARSADLAAALDQAALARDASAAAELATARATLRAVEAAVEAERAAEAEARVERPPVRSIDELEARTAEIVDRRDELERGLIGFQPTSTEEVERALARSSEPATLERVTSPEALAVAEQLDALDRELGGLRDGDHGASRVVDVRAALEEARHALIEAEQAVRVPAIDRGVVDRLEGVHAELLEAIAKADTRFGGARTQRRVEELRAVEHQLLDQAGFTSYSDYMIGNSLLHVDPTKERALDDARAALGTAEEAVASATEQDEADLARAALLDRRRGLLDQARELLGRPVGGTGASEALRSVRVEGSVVADHRGPLRDALEAGGLALGDDPLELDDLTALAEAWLEEVRHAAIRAQHAREELEALETERREVTAELDTQRADAASMPAEDPETSRAGRLAAARLDLEVLEDRLQAHQEAERAVESLTRDLEAAAEEEQAAILAAAEAEAGVAAAQAAEEPLAAEQRRLEAALAVAVRAEADLTEELLPRSDHEDDADHTALTEAAEAAAVALASLVAQREAVQREVDALRAAQPPEDEADAGGAVDQPAGEEVEWYLLARLAAQRSVSLAGSVPLLLDDALVGLEEPALEHLLGRLERMADSVQVIVVSEDSAVTAWAIHVGEERAAVVYPSLT